MPLKQSRIPRLLARVEHALKRLLELIRLAVAATLANWKVLACRLLNRKHGTRLRFLAQSLGQDALHGRQTP